MVCPRWYKRQANFTFVLLSEKQNQYCGLKKQTKIQVTPQVKEKPLDPDHVQDTIRSFLGIQTHPLFSTCARTNASFLCIMSIQTTKKHE